MRRQDIVGHNSDCKGRCGSNHGSLSWQKQENTDANHKEVVHELRWMTQHALMMTAVDMNGNYHDGNSASCQRTLRRSSLLIRNVR